VLKVLLVYTRQTVLTRLQIMLLFPKLCHAEVLGADTDVRAVKGMGLRSIARLPGSRVRMLPQTWMSIVSTCIVCCQVEVSATDRLLVQRGPTEWRVWEWSRNLNNVEASAHWGCRAIKKKLWTFINKLTRVGPKVTKQCKRPQIT
jgi:hypothetical protein